ncbi:iron-containing alcohol dehydrogenase [Novosphingobium rosa]|uniref:iron-containing alcohol dehydrogenase n=1 Tax=Novosphingobium rosa TaxID=76978 RepID=UPI00082CEDCB|nr:iron-containing alcohol dehydrogenase [Novosphingobium rosa]
MRFDFHYGPTLRMGAGSACDLAEMLPHRRMLIVTDPGVRRAGLLDAPLAALVAAGREVTIFDAVEADPSRETVLSAVSTAMEAAAECVIGFGGGSPMDVAKLVAYLARSGDSLDRIWGVGLATDMRLPLALVPTTAGTGSEATPVTIVTVAGGEKRGVSSRQLLPDWAVLDPELTVGLPRSATAATGIDAMVHAIEAYTSAILKNPLSDMLARQALLLLSTHLLTACEEPGNITAREAMLLGAHLAGVAFANAPVGGVHALAYPLGGHFHVPHGLSNALMLTHVLTFNMPGARALYAELGVLLDPALAGLGEQAKAQGLIASLERLIEGSGLVMGLSSVGVRRDQLDLLSDEAMKQQRLLKNNPVAITREDAYRLYEAAL